MKPLLIIFLSLFLPLTLPAQGYSYDIKGNGNSTANPPEQTQPARPYRYDLSGEQPQPPRIESPGRVQNYNYNPATDPSPVRESSNAYETADKPAYCNDFPESYEKAGFPPPPGGDPLPRFASRAVKEYKVQCAILKRNHPANYPFHPSLIARWRPCEEVWVVESRDSFKDRRQAESLQKQLRDLGYRGAYIIELIGYEGE